MSLLNPLGIVWESTTDLELSFIAPSSGFSGFSGLVPWLGTMVRAPEVSDNIDWAVVPGMKLIPLSLFDLDGIVKPKQAHLEKTASAMKSSISVGDLLDDQGRYMT